MSDLLAALPLVVLTYLLWRRRRRPTYLTDRLGPLGPSAPTPMDRWTNTDRRTDRGWRQANP